MPSDERATVSTESQDCFSARALNIDQQSDQELLHQLFRMAFPTCETSMLLGPEEQQHLSLMSRAGEEEKKQYTAVQSSAASSVRKSFRSNCCGSPGSLRYHSCLQRAERTSHAAFLMCRKEQQPSALAKASWSSSQSHLCGITRSEHSTQTVQL